MDVEQKLRQHVLENFLFTDDQSALASSDSFLEKGIIDSTGIMEVVLFMEEEFGIEVEVPELIPANLDSIDNLVAFVKRKRAG
jgi:acyl carrier protein